MLEEMQWLLANFFYESDMSFVYIDSANGLVLSHRDFYGKRSLVLQAKHVCETGAETGKIELLYSSCVMVDSSREDVLSFEQPSNSLLIFSVERDWLDLVQFDD